MTPEQERVAIEAMERATREFALYQKSRNATTIITNRSDLLAQTNFTALQAFLKEQGMVVVERSVIEKSFELTQTWCAVHAPDECSEKHVKAAQDRISEGGTLWYIATIAEQLRKYLEEWEQDDDT